MKIRIFTILIILLSAISINIFAQKKNKSKSTNTGYNIKITVDGVKDTVVYLGNYYNGKKYSIDTAQVNSKGQFTFKGEDKLAKGMYIIFLPSQGMTYFDLLIADDQEFSLSTDTSGLYIKNMKVKGSIDNEEFYVFKKQFNEINRQVFTIQKEMKEKKDDKEFIDAQKEKLKELSKKNEELLIKTVETSKSKTLISILNLMREPKIPEFKIDENIANKDSVIRIKQYYYYKDHYFDYFNFQDSSILRTPMFQPKLKQYISQVIIQIPDSVSKAGIELIEKARGCHAVFQYLVVTMLRYQEDVKIMGMDRVFYDIAKKYYLTGEADWVDSTILSNIKTRANYIEHNLLGDQAVDLQNLETLDKKHISLYDIDAKYTILIFWEPSCGHCKKAVPQLYSEYLDMVKQGIDVEVLAICTHPEPEPWKKFIKEKETTDWINAFDRYMMTNFKLLYDVNFTPTLYLLDKDKRIIGKRLDAAQVQKMILQLEKMGKK